ncbi:MAG: Calcium binding protein, partial [Candidatus Scalindua rubra]
CGKIIYKGSSNSLLLQKYLKVKEKGPLKYGDKLKVIGISVVDDLYGIIVKVDRERQSYSIPLCDIQVIDINEKNYELVSEYSEWFCNEYM